MHIRKTAFTIICVASSSFPRNFLPFSPNPAGFNAIPDIYELLLPSYQLFHTAYIDSISSPY